nr:SDR family NAD(P)-dependent oxidoreductase [Saprospiraceae bacterium]
MNKSKENVVFITGATSGIGKACAEVFARNGHPLVITGRRSERLTEIKRGLTEKYGIEMASLSFDIRDPKACDLAWNSLESKWRTPDLLINNAGLAKGLTPIHQGSLEHWETMIDTNIKGLLYITRLISPGMVERKRGHIINVCSTAGHETYPMGNVYCATKHAVNALTNSMRLDLYTHGIKVGQVSPAHVEETEFAVNRFDGDEEKGDIYSDFNPLKSNDVAEAIYFIYTRPAHVNIQDILMMGTQQAGSNFIHRSGRIY